MKKTKIKTAPPAIATREQMLSAMAEVRALTIERNALAVAREREIAEIDEAYAPDIADLDEQIKALAESLQLWAVANRDQFGGKQSLETPHGRLVFRIGQWALETIKGWVWYRTAKTPPGKHVVIEAMKQQCLMPAFIRTVEEIDKAGIIASRDQVSADDLAAIGLKLVKDEAFSVEPNVETPNNKAEAA